MILRLLRLLTIVFSLLSVNGVQAEKRLELKLWPNGAPNEAGDIGPERTLPPRGTKEVIRLTDVTVPTITLYSPKANEANGCTVVVCPGGGYSILAWDLEGTEIAEWLNTIGVTAVVLKYRVPRRDPKQPHAAPLQDVQRATRLVRKNASAWNIDTDRIGVLGFSAGGHLAVMACTHWDKRTYEAIDDADKLSCKPDFLIPIYPAYLADSNDPSRLSPLVRINKETPPTFIVVTYDDKTRGADSALLLVALKQVGVSAELHVFSKGGHGYGMRASDDPVSGWPRLCEQWMRVSGLLESIKSK